MERWEWAAWKSLHHIISPWRVDRYGPAFSVVILHQAKPTCRFRENAPGFFLISFLLRDPVQRSKVGVGLTRNGHGQARSPTMQSGFRSCEPACCPERRGSRIR